MACVGELSSIWLPQVQATVLATALPWLENTTSSRYGYGFIGVYLAHVKIRRGCRGSKRDLQLAVSNAFEEDQHDTKDLTAFWLVRVTRLFWSSADSCSDYNSLTAARKQAEMLRSVLAEVAIKCQSTCSRSPGGLWHSEDKAKKRAVPDSVPSRIRSSAH